MGRTSLHDKMVTRKKGKKTKGRSEKRRKKGFKDKGKEETSKNSRLD